jgi:hypothetical protein
MVGFQYHTFASATRVISLKRMKQNDPMFAVLHTYLHQKLETQGSNDTHEIHLP